MKQYSPELIERFGSPEAVLEHYRAMQKRSRLNYKGTGGFAKRRDIASAAGKKGAEIRWGKKEKDKAE